MERMIPYQNLYIYEISGEILGSRSFFKEDFIGCWNEGEASYLFFSQPHDEEVEVFVRKKGFFEKRWFLLSGLFLKDGEEIERRLNRRSIGTYLKIQEKNWLTLIGLKNLGIY
jgi:hypothetical protein